MFFREGRGRSSSPASLDTSGSKTCSRTLFQDQAKILMRPVTGRSGERKRTLFRPDARTSCGDGLQPCSWQRSGAAGGLPARCGFRFGVQAIIGWRFWLVMGAQNSALLHRPRCVLFDCLAPRFAWLPFY